MSNLVYIVDPLSSGSYLAPRVHEKYGYKTVAILSTPNILPGLISSFHPEHFEFVIHGESVQEIISEVEKIEEGGKPFAVICGSEPGVELYDELTQHWNLSPNVAGLRQARRDKFLMQNRLKEVGINYIPHLKSGDSEEIYKWCEQNLSEKYVIKPLKSFGSDSVYFTDNAEETAVIAKTLLGTRNLSGAINDELLIETYVQGTEYVVDAVSYNGEHSIINVFQYEKDSVNGNPIYRTMRTIDPQDVKELVRYICDVLDALGIQSGPSHNEVFLTTQGPVLVESGSRMHGGQGPKLVEMAFSQSLIDETIESRLPSAHDRERSASTLVSNAVECFLSSDITGTVVRTYIDELLKNIPSFIYHTANLTEGDRVERTNDLLTSYGRVVLCNSDIQQLNEDLKRVQDLDAKGLLLDLRP